MMNAERIDEKAVFNTARKITDPEARSSYIELACADNPEALQRVLDLLRVHDEQQSFLESPPPGLDVTQGISPITEQPGDTIGPYKLLQQIGEGGMGVVYMAEQKEPVKRRVALKIIKPGMDTRQVIARFEAERQALAMMDHPNIAKVLDAGQAESGRPYFVMELVNGLPVTKYCDDQHLTPKERLELFVPICEAVQHAHQKGIIHRDLKPSNILVAMYDNKVLPKIIDFGVAKATSQTLTEKTMFTQLGQVVGTLEYMSPEQAQRNQLDIDTRSDIYSLGVVLYELLTGETPFDRARLRSAAFDELLRIIREEEPSKPSTKVSSSQSLPSIAASRRIEPAKLGRMIRGELDWIVLKAMEKDRGRRYETASKFAEDLQRYLNDEAVVACPPSRAYRFRKFARRNRAALISATFLSIALLVAISGIMGGVGWAVRDRVAREAEIARERAEREAEATRERDERLARIRTQVEVILSDVDWLAEEQRWDQALVAAKRAEAALASGEVEAAVSAGVRTAVRELEFVARLEEIRINMSRWDLNGFDYAGAAQGYARAFHDFGVDLASLPVAASTALLKQHPRILLPVAVALDDFAFARRQVAKTEFSDADWQPLVEIARKIDPDTLRNQLRAMWGREVTPERQAALRKMAESYDPHLHGPWTVCLLANTLAEAGIADLTEVILREGQREFPGDFWVNWQLGHTLHDRNKYEEAVRFYSVATGIKPNSFAAYHNLAVSLKSQGKLDEAIACYRQAFEIDTFGFAYDNLGAALTEQGELDEAIICFRRAIEIDPEWSEAHYNIGVLLRDQRKPEEAIASFRKAIELAPEYFDAHYNLGVELYKQRKLEESIKSFRQAITIAPEAAIAHQGLGLALRDLLDEQHQKGNAALRSSVASAVEYLAIEAPDSRARANSLFEVGRRLEEWGFHEEALSVLRTCLDSCDRISKSAPDDHAIARQYAHLLVSVFPWIDDLSERERYLEKADDILACELQYLEKNDPNGKSQVFVLRVLGELRMHQHRWGESLEHLKHAARLSPNDPWVHYVMAQYYLSADEAAGGNPRDAMRHALQCITVVKNHSQVRTVCDQAIDVLQKSLERDVGHDAEAGYLMSLGLARLDRWEQAVEAMNKAEQVFAELDESSKSNLKELRSEALALIKTSTR